MARISSGGGMFFVVSPLFPLLDLCRESGLVGSRFVPPSVAKKYDLDLPEYPGADQIVELPSEQQESKAEKILTLAEGQMP